MFCVYVIERDDGLKYVGKTYLEKIKTRMYYHKKTKRFRDHEISYSVLFTTESHEEVLEKETYYVEQLDTFHNGLNKTKDGKAMNTNSYRFTTLGFSMAVETKEKIREKSIKNKNYLYAQAWHHNPKNKAKWDEVREKMSKNRKGKFNRPVTDEQVENIRQLLLLYKSHPEVSRSGIQQNGRNLSYERAFSTDFHKRFNLTDVQVYNIIKGRTIVWKELLEEILDLKS